MDVGHLVGRTTINIVVSCFNYTKKVSLPFEGSRFVVDEFRRQHIYIYFVCVGNMDINYITSYVSIALTFIAISIAAILGVPGGSLTTRLYSRYGKHL